MSLFESLDDVPRTLHHCALAIGNFDGVHLGHQALIAQVCRIKEAGLRGALTFSPHPALLLAPAKEHFSISSDEQKARLLLALGLDFLIIYPLTREFLGLSPDAFVDQILVNKLKVSDVVVGEDFSFGAKALGKVPLLAQKAEAQGFSLHVVPDVLLHHERVSSSAIREHLSKGEVALAREMLTRPYALMGRVSSGQGLGTPLGFATANLMPPRGFGLAHGIYATMTRVYFNDGVKDFLSATSVGTRPTVTDSAQVVVETHCLDQAVNLLGLDIEIYFIAWLRDEEKFSGVAALQAQVQQDILQVRQLAKLNPRRFEI